MRLWFNKQFDDLMNLKKREIGLVDERNARLRFIIYGNKKSLKCLLIVIKISIIVINNLVLIFIEQN